MYIYLFYLNKNEEENTFQSLNVGKDLKWKMVITKFHKFHNIKMW